MVSELGGDLQDDAFVLPVVLEDLVHATSSWSDIRFLVADVSVWVLAFLSQIRDEVFPEVMIENLLLKIQRGDAPPTQEFEVAVYFSVGAHHAWLGWEPVTLFTTKPDFGRVYIGGAPLLRPIFVFVYMRGFSYQNWFLTVFI